MAGRASGEIIKEEEEEEIEEVDAFSPVAPEMEEITFGANKDELARPEH